MREDWSARKAEHRRTWRARWLSGRGVLIRARFGVTVAVFFANIIGAATAALEALFVVPEPHVGHLRSLLTENAEAAFGYTLFGAAVGLTLAHRKMRSLAGWLLAERAPSPDEQRAVLRAPRALAGIVGWLWSVAAIVFGVINGLHDPQLGARIATLVFGSGVVTAAASYLFAERLLREAAGRALTAAESPQRIAQSVVGRALSTWMLGTGVPMLGIVLLGVASLAGLAGTRWQLALAMVVLGADCLITGFVLTAVATAASADPIRSVRRGLADLEAGNLDAAVTVYDGTELGLLQAGFNRMAAGLRERERLRDLFGRHVGVDVARRAIEDGVALGGEQRDVAVLFVDVVASTQFAAHRPPTQVVESLNRFFAVVVGVVEAHGGLINKFTGDAALAIFGAPTAVPDCADRALAAACDLAERLAAEVPEFDSGIGVAAGLAVAGNIGTPQRLEYTVIGDPVNEAARLTEVAKTMPGRVVASGEVIKRATRPPADWRFVEEIVVRGRDVPTQVFVPGGERDQPAGRSGRSRRRLRRPPPHPPPLRGAASQ
ncbi:MAG TPA: adenylate/guanylate cyclase domain-containing protein [Mycobacteriales bacterium]|nr:adenylate/guanylate cyclase domain-containing protein [Mycobacteriales bacterium]